MEATEVRRVQVDALLRRERREAALRLAELDARRDVMETDVEDVDYQARWRAWVAARDALDDAVDLA